MFFLFLVIRAMRWNSITHLLKDEKSYAVSRRSASSSRRGHEPISSEQRKEALSIVQGKGL